MFKFSTSNHLNKCKTTEELFKPTSIKIVIAMNVVITIDKHVIKWEPVIPIFLPKNPDIIEPIIGNINKDK